MNVSASNGEPTPHPSAEVLESACWLCGAEAQPDPEYGSAGFVRCRDCGFLYAPGRSTEELHSLYTDDYFENFPGGTSYIKDLVQRRYEAKNRLDWVLNHRSHGRLLEVGSANGVFLSAAQSAGFTVSGIEPAAGLARAAQEAFGVEVQAAFIESAALPSGELDLVCAWHVLEHLRDPVPALQRLRSSLRPDGMLFLELPNIDSVRARRIGASWFHLDPANHVAFYSTRTMGDVLGQSGFELLDAHTVSAHSLLRPRLALNPYRLALRAYDTWLERAWQHRPHPTKHEMLRVIARPS